MRFRAGACSARGTARAVNQDHVAIHALDEQTLLAVIADGLGSYSHSEVASALATSLVMSQLDQSRQLRNFTLASLKQAVRDANLVLWHYALEHGHAMKTTLTALLCTSDSAILAHVGDCRTYVLRAGEARQLTTDHSRAHYGSWWGRLSSGMLGTPYERGRHTLTRVLGDHPIVRIDTLQVPIQSQDHFILCSDGIWSGVSPASLAALAVEQKDVVGLAHTLVCQAQAQGSTDDASAIVVSVDALDAACAAPGCIAPKQRAARSHDTACTIRDSAAYISICRLG